jgi:hypothetical protein
VPKSGRDPFAPDDVDTDKKMFERWKQLAVADIPTHARDDWDLLAIAQHHGLATRLLDWTYNALIAAFFAVVDSRSLSVPNEDCVVWAHYTKETVDPQKEEPFGVTGYKRLRPKGVVPRVVRQGGYFTIHNPPSTALEDKLNPEDKLVRMIIKGSYRSTLAIELSHYGVNSMSLFPDLDGLARHLNWVFTSMPSESA